MLHLEVQYLGAGDLAEIVELFPHVDQREDDSESPPIQALIDVTPTSGHPLELLTLVRCVGRIPAEVNVDELTTAIAREVKRAQAFNGMAVFHGLDPAYLTRLWFLVTWEPTATAGGDHEALN